MDHVPKATIEIDPDLFTVIIQFEVDARRGEDFARELTQAVSETIVQLPGFHSAAFQLSNHHTRVINYAQWQSNGIYDRSMASLDPDNDLVGQVVAPHGAHVVHSDAYTVVATFPSRNDRGPALQPV